MVDNPASWIALFIIAISFFYAFFAKIIHDLDERKKEAEDYWKNEYKYK